MSRTLVAAREGIPFAPALAGDVTMAARGRGYHVARERRDDTPRPVQARCDDAVLSLRLASELPAEILACLKSHKTDVLAAGPGCRSARRP